VQDIIMQASGVYSQLVNTHQLPQEPISTETPRIIQHHIIGGSRCHVLTTAARLCCCHSYICTVC